MQRGIFTLSVFFLTVFAIRAFGADDRITYPATAVTAIDVDVASSDIEVTGTTGKESTLEIRKRNWDESCRVDSKLEGKTWRVSVDTGHGWHNRCEVSLRFNVAPTTSVTIEAASGDLELTDISGALDIRTGSGDVKARTLSDNARVRTGSGDIDIDLSSHLQRPTGAPKLRVDTGSGDISLTTIPDLKGADLNIRTGSGDCNIRLPKDAKLQARHSTGSGSLESAFPTSSDKPTFFVEARSGSGDLVLSAL